MPVSSYFRIVAKKEKKYRWTRYDHDVSLCLSAELAAAIADQIVRLRCKRAVAHYAAWQQAVAGGPKPSGTTATALHAYLDVVVGVQGGAPVNADHLQGLVAEHIWYFLLEGEAVSSDTIRIEPPGFKPTDQGADGLSVHRNPDGSLTFCLWEIKKSVGARGAGGTMSRAALQLKTRALEYLARYTCTGEEIPDQAIEELYSRLIEHWGNASPSASAGVAVATNTADAPQRCFTTLPKHLTRLSSPPRLTGQLTTVGDFVAFAEEVRQVVWTGL